MMEHSRKVIVYIAQSVDGYIAKKDDDIGWLSMVDTPGEDYGYVAFVESVDTVIMGRRTYEKVLSFGVEFPHKERKTYVLSNSQKGSDNHVEYYSGDVKELIDNIRSTDGGHLFVDGGAEVIKEFASQDLIDEYVISTIPILIGNGIRLFKETEQENKLKLLESKSFSSGLVQNRYLVIRDEDKQV
ncbi:dihydrofolate reductase family protein [Bacillus sp. CHD6a]|uniref:dihydrofolate reductase family protein n=1 Tax=Bacillus sp. CHD6a TaxID=1643452 RepID=UPI0018D1EC45|nr:dihydrofolate reductase family protein [Bacillus sp. CHD6a]